MPDLRASAGDSDFYFVPAEEPESAVQRILELVKTRVPKRFGASFDGRSVTYGFDELDTLIPAYAATIHKS
jgi:hypothetical protein